METTLFTVVGLIGTLKNHAPNYAARCEAGNGAYRPVAKGI